MGKTNMPNYTEKKQHGFTLIELLLYMIIVSSLLVGVTLFYATASDSRIKNQSISEVNQQGAFIMGKITQSIRNADNIVAPALAASDSILTIAVPTAALSPTTFSLSGTNILMKEGTGAEVALNSNTVQIQNLVFKNLSSSTAQGHIQVSFDVKRVNTNGRGAYDFQKTFVSSGELQW